MNSIRLLALGITLLVVIFLATGCDEDAPVTTEPPTTTPADTTSHDFVWEFDTIGIQFSLITSVAAIAPDDIWVTGQFFRNDSLGKPISKPEGNVAHWNGREWTIHRFNSTGRTSWHLMHEAYARGPENIWISGGGPHHWDGVSWTPYVYKNKEKFGSGVIETWASKNAEYACVVGLNRSCGYYRKGETEFTKLNIPDPMDCIDLVGFEDGTVYVASGDAINGIIYKVTPDHQVREYHRIYGGEPRALWWQDGDLHYAKHFEIRRVRDSGAEIKDEHVFFATQQFSVTQLVLLTETDIKKSD